MFVHFLPVPADAELGMNDALVRVHNAMGVLERWIDSTEERKGVVLETEYVVEKDWWTYYDGAFSASLEELDPVGVSPSISHNPKRATI